MVYIIIIGFALYPRVCQLWLWLMSLCSVILYFGRVIFPCFHNSLLCEHFTFLWHSVTLEVALIHEVCRYICSLFLKLTWSCITSEAYMKFAKISVNFWSGIEMLLELSYLHYDVPSSWLSLSLWSYMSGFRILNAWPLFFFLEIRWNIFFFSYNWTSSIFIRLCGVPLHLLGCYITPFCPFENHWLLWEHFFAPGILAMLELSFDRTPTLLGF